MTATNPPARDGTANPASATELLYSVLYCSHASPTMTEAGMAEIIETSRRNNPARGITGLLVYGGGMFLQWLEGPREPVTALMETLRNDPRHDAIVRLHAIEGVKERLFPDWDMEHVEPSDIRELLLDQLGVASNVTHAEAISLLLLLLETGDLASMKA